MRIGQRSSSLAAAAAALAFTLACGNDSNTVAGTTAVSTSASLAGTWSGTYDSLAPGCATTPMTVAFSQDGATVTGSVTTNSCGPHGFFKATLSGNTLSGRIEMAGCTGGGVMGTVSGGVLSLSIGNFYRPLTNPGETIIKGGQATLER